MLHAQARITADRLGDLQVGVDFSLAKPDYAGDLYNLAQPTNGENRWHGYGVYTTFDLRHHLGVAFDFHQLSGPDPVLYERTYELGLRYSRPVGQRLLPYVKIMEGRGVFNFAAVDASGQSVQIANLAFNTQSLGGGVDLHVTRGINVRVFDYEYQHWDNFPPNRLNPQVLSFGVAYHFHGSTSGRR